MGCWASGTVVAGGQTDAEGAYVAPTLIRDPSMDEPVMREEIFGPLLPIFAVSGPAEAVARVNAVCNRPLALYVFAEDQKAIDTVLNGTNSGGVCVNTVMEHFSNNHMPFGGVGESGMGRYHGKHGFDEFSHHRSVLVKDTRLIKGPILPPPPYTSDKLYDLAVKMQVTGFLTPGQKTVAKLAAAGVVAYVVKRFAFGGGRSKL